MTNQSAVAVVTTIEHVVESAESAETAVILRPNFGNASEPLNEIAQRLIADAAQRIATVERDGAGRAGLLKGAFSSGRTDLISINPYLLTVRPDWNSRDIGSAGFIAGIDLLAKDIAKRGVLQPLTVKPEGNTLYVTDGHRRLMAVHRAITVYGADIRTVNILTEPRGSSAKDILTSQIHRNGSLELTSLEKGVWVKKFLALGGTEIEAAGELNLSEAQVGNLLDAQALSEPVKAMIRDDKVSFTNALKVYRESGESDAKTIAVLSKGLDVATAQGKSKVSPKHLGDRPKKVNALKELKEIFLRATKTRSTVMILEADFGRFKELLGVTD